jgi:hypothetical protein
MGVAAVVTGCLSSSVIASLSHADAAEPGPSVTL